MLHVGRFMVRLRRVFFFAPKSSSPDFRVLVTRLAYFMCIAGVQLDINKNDVRKFFDPKIIFRFFAVEIFPDVKASSSLKIT